MPDSDNLLLNLLDAIDPVFEDVVGVLPFPVNLVVSFIWGGIMEAIDLFLE